LLHKYGGHSFDDENEMWVSDMEDWVCDSCVVAYTFSNLGNVPIQLSVLASEIKPEKGVTPEYDGLFEKNTLTDTQIMIILASVRGFLLIATISAFVFKHMRIKKKFEKDIVDLDSRLCD